MTQREDFDHPRHMHAAYVGTLATSTEVNWAQQVDRSQLPEKIEDPLAWRVWSQTDKLGVFSTYEMARKAAMKDPPNSYAVACIEHFLTAWAMARLRPPERSPLFNYISNTTLWSQNLSIAQQQQSQLMSRLLRDHYDKSVFEELMKRGLSPTGRPKQSGALHKAIHESTHPKEPDHVPFRTSNAHQPLRVLLDRDAQRRQRGRRG